MALKTLVSADCAADKPAQLAFGRTLI